jgi:hypothetical protein
MPAILKPASRRGGGGLPPPLDSRLTIAGMTDLEILRFSARRSAIVDRDRVGASTSAARCSGRWPQQGPWCARGTPARWRSQSLRYVAPSQPQTGASSGPQSRFIVRQIPMSIASPHRFSPNSQNSPGEQSLPLTPPQPSCPGGKTMTTPRCGCTCRRGGVAVGVGVDVGVVVSIGGSVGVGVGTPSDDRCSGRRAVGRGRRGRRGRLRLATVPRFTLACGPFVVTTSAKALVTKNTENTATTKTRFPMTCTPRSLKADSSRTTAL